MLRLHDRPHSSPLWKLRWLSSTFFIAWIFVNWVTPASADPINVIDNGQKIGTVDFSNYGVRYSYIDSSGRRITHAAPRQGPPLVNVDTGGGANFDATFNFTGCPPGTSLCPGAQFQWSRSSRPTLHRRVPCEAMRQRLDTSILGLRLAAEPEREVRATRTLSRSIGPMPNWRIRTLVATPR